MLNKGLPIRLYMMEQSPLKKIISLSYPLDAAFEYSRNKISDSVAQINGILVCKSFLFLSQQPANFVKKKFYQIALYAFVPKKDGWLT